MNILSSSVGINTNAPNASAILDISSTLKGVLIPRMTTGQKIAIVSPVAGLQVYDTTLNSLSWFNGSSWAAVTASVGWGILGNAGTNSTSNFIGTTDAQNLSFRVNNIFYGYLGQGNNSIMLGMNAAAPTVNTGLDNVAIGNGANNAAGSGGQNVSIGAYANNANTSGGTNTAVGYNALSLNTTGFNNAYVGAYAGNGATGSFNTTMGYSAAMAQTGNYNVSIGSNTGAGMAAGAYNTFLGALITIPGPTSNFNTLLGAQINIPSGTSSNIILADGQGNQRINVGATGLVGVGGLATPASSLSVNQGTGTAVTKGIQLTGNPISGGGTGTGFLMSLGYNTTGNKQLWFVDPDLAGNAVNFATRFSSNGGFPLIDTISTNGTVSGVVNIGTVAGSKTVIGGAYGVALAPLSQFSVNGNTSIGAAYSTVAAPTDGLIVVGNVGIGTSTPTVPLDVNGTARIRSVPSATTATTVSLVGVDNTGDIVKGYFATGIIGMGDVGGTNTVGTGSSMYNATYVKSNANQTLTITFGTANASTGYLVLAELYGNCDSVNWYVQSKAVGSCVIAFQEQASVVQNVQFSFIVINR